MVFYLVTPVVLLLLDESGGQELLVRLDAQGPLRRVSLDVSTRHRRLRFRVDHTRPDQSPENSPLPSKGLGVGLRVEVYVSEGRMCIPRLKSL